jgi:hypothetical protein
MEDAMRNIFFRVFIMLLVVTAFSAGCSNSSPSVKPATAEPDRISAEEPVEAVAEVSAIADASPTSESGPPAVFSYVILEGLLTVTSQRYEEVLDMCNPFPPGASGCMDTYNPCPEEGGGGGGGGGGDDVACLKMPDYCYKCKPDFGATYFFSLLDPERMYISPSTTRFFIDIDPKGYILRFDWGYSFGGERPEQTEFTSEPGSFHTRWNLFNPNLEGKTPGYIIVDGSGISFNVTEIKFSDEDSEFEVTDLKGSGTWEIGHPLFGATGSGTWAFDYPYFSYTVNP